MIYWLPPVVMLPIYLVIGWQIAMHELPALWEEARRTEIDAYPNLLAACPWRAPGMLAAARSQVRDRTMGLIFFWPVIFAARAVQGRFDQAIDAGDSVGLAAKVAERDQRIAQLEHDLGIKDRP
jgi:hypothetical protein